MSENKTSPQLWATVTIAVAIIACLGTVISAIIAKVPIPTLPAFTPTPNFVVVTETPVTFNDPASKNNTELSSVIYADINDVEIGNNECDNWVGCWDSSYGNYLVKDYLEGTVSADLLSSKYVVRRIVIPFDTSSIPHEAIIKKVTLHFHAGEFQSGNPTIHIVHSTANSPITNYDFGKKENLSGGSASPSPSTWSIIQFSQEALSWINKGGTSDFYLIHDYDLNNNQPKGANSVTISMAENNQFRAYIEIIFEMP